ncbi:nuclear transport factor 2 family protein [Endozoicomonas elysicola]|uniref:SnoaL-like domain-containing protein n=1 Tax=Endozoicomonas elysicola TaxID=305900 RepID=A0A081KEQ3_9GAMM|nr:nuclear transport factor 2 family protein [Endozoicomonas elysicola]KEI72629.1 hypothetical protein GV64_19530 [Endozoicomonas elysicola]
MKTPLEVTQTIYQLFSEGNLAGFIDLCHEDIHWVVNGPADLKKCQSYRGKQGVQQFLDILGETWTFSSFNPKEFIVQGDTVVALGEESGKDISRDQPFYNRWAHIFTIENGRLVQFREFLCCWFGEEKAPDMNWSTMH